MRKLYLASIYIIAVGILCPFFLAKDLHAASFNAPKDTITTSRPSASAPIDADLAASKTQVNFYDNGSRFIASDSAKLIGQTLEVVTVASMSASSGSPAKRTLFFTGQNANAHTNGTVVMTPITATHAVSFTTVNGVPSNGKIKIYFPIGDTTNQASPSASGFSFNGLSSNNVSATGATCGSWTTTAASGLVQCNLSVAITAPTSVTISIGVGTSGPTVINPTKTAAAGTADTWTVQIRSTDNSDVEIDYSKVKIGTIESVEVFATVDPTFTFAISGLTNAAAVNIGNTNGCTNTETINTGFNSTATEVNMGVLGSGTINISAQLLTITTNGIGGYSLTATSSGHLIDPDIGYWIKDSQGTPTANDTPVPALILAGTPAFGIHPCGLEALISAPDWAEGAGQTCTTGGGTDCYYANPSPVYYYSLASDSTGPIGDTALNGNGLVTVEYAATISSAVPAGTYRTAMTYVATPTF